VEFDGELSVRRQCELLGVNRSSVYYEPVPESELNLKLMRLIDEQYTRRPFYGSRKMTVWLQGQHQEVNRKRVQRLMRLMGIEAIFPTRNLSRRNPEHEVYPYLLRGLTIDRPNQVWATDITYIRMARGFLYLVAVMDWFSRYVLSWRLSNTLDTSFCVEALDEALTVYPQPSIFNSDQGSQFTAADFVGRLKQVGIQISMDGRGRALDNVFVERLWRTVKYEEVYLNDYEDGFDADGRLGRYFLFYNVERPHQSLSYRTPASVYGHAN
jgi:putative transposase